MRFKQRQWLLVPTLIASLIAAGCSGQGKDSGEVSADREEAEAGVDLSERKQRALLECENLASEPIKGTVEGLVSMLGISP